MVRTLLVACGFVLVFSACGHKAPPKPPEDKKENKKADTKEDRKIIRKQSPATEPESR